jgi:hypothetical protein
MRGKTTSVVDYNRNIASSKENIIESKSNEE